MCKFIKATPVTEEGSRFYNTRFISRIIPAEHYEGARDRSTECNSVLLMEIQGESVQRFVKEHPHELLAQL